jgi:hypothetical protein
VLEHRICAHGLRGKAVNRKGAAFAAILAAAMLTVPLHAAPGDMTVATFLGKYEALKKKGVFALGSPDIAKLKTEGQEAGEAYTARLKSDRAAGRPAHSCAPPGGRLSQSEFIAGVKRYPVAARTDVTLKEAVADLMKKKYPCKT